MEFKTKQDEEIEKLATNLKNNKLAHSDSEARRMAMEMLNIGKKVADDFAQRKRAMIGDEKKDADVEKAHKVVEQLTANISSGKNDVRVDMGDIDTSKPLNQLMSEDEKKEQVSAPQPTSEPVAEPVAEPVVEQPAEEPISKPEIAEDRHQQPELVQENPIEESAEPIQEQETASTEEEALPETDDEVEQTAMDDSAEEVVVESDEGSVEQSVEPREEAEVEHEDVSIKELDERENVAVSQEPVEQPVEEPVQEAELEPVQESNSEPEPQQEEPSQEQTEQSSEQSSEQPVESTEEEQIPEKTQEIPVNNTDDEEEKRRKREAMPENNVDFLKVFGPK